MSTAAQIVETLLEAQHIFANADEAYASLKKAKWREWQQAGVKFSPFHFSGNKAFELPFRPESYLWAGPVTLQMPADSTRQGHYRRGVQKYSNMLAKGARIDPVCLVYHDAWGWTLQDGNHRFEALAASGAPTYEAFLGMPKKEMTNLEFD